MPVKAEGNYFFICNSLNIVNFRFFNVFSSFDHLEAKETFSLYDDVGDGKIDCLQIGTVARALGLKPTNAMVHKAAGQEFKRSGKFINFLILSFCNFYLFNVCLHVF